MQILYRMKAVLKSMKNEKWSWKIMELQFWKLVGTLYNEFPLLTAKRDNSKQGPILNLIRLLLHI